MSVNKRSAPCVSGDSGLAVTTRSRPRQVRVGRRWTWCLGLSVLVWLAVAASASAQETGGLAAVLAVEQGLTQLIEQSEPSVVSIARIKPSRDGNAEGRFLAPGLNPAGKEGRDVIPNQFAAGVIVSLPDSSERLILTVYHAVRGGPTFGVPGSGDGSRLEVRFASRHAVPASIVAADPRSDLAVLRLELRGSNLNPAELRPIAWRNSPAVQKGQLVVTLGNPYWIARDGSASAGWAMVSNVARRPIASATQPEGPRTLDGLGGLIHLDARLPVGSSGGSVVNLQGELVGLTTSLAAVEGYPRSGGFALPINQSTAWIVESLLSGREVEYGFLGIQPATVPHLPAGLSSQASAAMVEAIFALSPAAEAGMRRGDVVLAVDGVPTYNDLDLMRQVTLHPPESVVKLTVLRGGREETLTLAAKLGKWPTSDDEAIIATQPTWPTWRGLTFDYPTARHRFLDYPPRIRPGVLVSGVAEGSPAKDAQLEPGVFVSHVNRTAVRTPAEFVAAIRNETGNVSLRVILANDTTKVVTIGE